MIYAVRQGDVGWRRGRRRRNLVMLLGGMAVYMVVRLSVQQLADDQARKDDERPGEATPRRAAGLRTRAHLRGQGQARHRGRHRRPARGGEPQGVARVRVEKKI